MRRYLLLTGYAGMDSWGSCATKASELPSGFAYSKPYELADYYVVFVNLPSEGRTSDEFFEKLFKKIGIELRQDEVVIFAHGAHTKHNVGSKDEDFYKLSVQGDLCYHLFATGFAHDRQHYFPFWLINAINNCLQGDGINWNSPKYGTIPSWDEIQVEARKRPRGLSVLKHRLGHVFLSLRTDCAGIIRSGEHERLEYARKVIEEHQVEQNYYLRLLADYQFFVLGKKDFELLTKITTHCTDTDLPDDYTIRKLLGDETFSWKLFLVKQTNNGEIDLESDVVKFLVALNDALEKRDEKIMVDVICGKKIPNFGGEQFIAWIRATDKALEKTIG